MESDNIAIFVRVRKQREDAGAKSVSTDPVRGIVVLHTPTEDRTFSFDRVGGEATTQEEIFEAVGQPLSDACMAGYNAAIFAYGQTGSGKTFTMGFEAEQASAAPDVASSTAIIAFLIVFLPIRASCLLAAWSFSRPRKARKKGPRCREPPFLAFVVWVSRQT
jgi:hypothetical protein